MGALSVVPRILGAIRSELGAVFGRASGRYAFDPAVVEIDATVSNGWGDGRKSLVSGVWIVGDHGNANSQPRLKTHGTGTHDLWYHSNDNPLKFKYQANTPFGDLQLLTAGAQGAAGSGATATASVSSDGVTDVTVTTNGSGYTSAPTVSFSGGGGTGAAATAIVRGGAVVGVTVTSAGTGYTSNPTVSFSGGGGSGAAASARAKGVTSIAVNAGGSGFVNVPDVTLSGGGGTGALAVARVSGGAVTGIVVTDSGSGYTSAPTVAFAGGGSHSAPAVTRMAWAGGYAAGAGGYVIANGTLITRAETGQTASSQEWRNPSNVVAASVRSDGLISAAKGVATFVKAGTPSDADWTTAPPDGTLVVDTTASKIWARIGGTWKQTAALT